MTNKIERHIDTDPNGEKSVMSKITETTAGLLSLAEIPKEDSYTLRLWIKANGVKNVSAYIGRNPYLLSVNTAWKQFKNTGTATANSTCDLYLPTGTYYIWHPMLERSTKASDYRQAPEDVQENINTAANDAVESANAYTNEVLKEYSTTEEMHSEIQQTQEMISLSVSKQTTRSMTYAQTQANNALTAAKADTDNKLKSYVTTTKHSADLTLLSDRITSAVTATETLAAYVDGDFYNQITNEYSSAITQTASGIESRVRQTYATITTVNGIASRVTTAESSIKQNADSITSAVKRLGTAESNITQNANSISSLTSTVNGHSSAITQNANAIKLRVETSKLVSEINASSGQIKMTSNRFVVDSTYFKLSANGTITATNVNLTGSLKTETYDGYYTHVHDGVIEQFMNDKRVGYIMPVIGSATQFSILGSGNYGGVAIGARFDNGIYTYYRMNIQDEYTRDGCRHHFVGTAKFDNTATFNGGLKLGGTLTTSTNNINFFNNYGISWGGNIALRYANSDVTHTGVWVGISDTRLCLNGTQIDAHAKLLMFDDQCIGSVDTDDNYYYVMLQHDSYNNAINVGTNSRSLWLKGSAIYANGSIISSSDSRMKKNIHNLPNKYLRLIKSIEPVSFEYTDDISQSGRTHTGFIAQQVLESMAELGIDTKDFAAFVDLKKDGSMYGLRYEEFIPLILAYIKDLEKQINKLRRNQL